MRHWLAIFLTVGLLPLTVVAQTVRINKQQAFPKTIPPANYSGITWIGGSRYAVVDDKSPTAGFCLMTITTDSLTGIIQTARIDTFLTCHQPNRDEEGICYVPQTNTLFVSGEADGQVLEYDMEGQLTGRKLQMPEVFSQTYSNGGLEALTYNAVTHRFWTTSEFTLRADGVKPSLQQRVRNRLRLQSFGDDLQPKEQYWYESDVSEVKKQKGRSVLGVSGLAALDDGRIVVLERELFLPPKKIGSFAQVKLYVVNPNLHQPGDTLHKTLIAEFRTKINISNRSFANYEGICVGPTLADGSLLLLLVCDSQKHYVGMLKDWLRTVVLTSE